MKCIKCLTKNINQANFCKKCGYKFSDKERKIASRWTPVWMLKKVESFIDFLKNGFQPFKFITDTKTFKVLSILVVLGIGVYSYFTKGNEFSILASDSYNIQHNKDTEEYYLVVKKQEVELNIFVPNYIDEISLKHYDDEDNLIQEENYKKEDKLKILAGMDDYYVLTVKEGEKSKDHRLYVYMQEVTK